MTRVLCAIALALSISAAHAADGTTKEPSPAQKAQQEKMKNCNQEAKSKELKGDERKSFMKECLSGKPSAAPAATQQEKMKACNQEAGEKALKGDERKTFMSSCLKG